VKRPTIKDVAREAGCSSSTVSIVLNNRGYVSDATRKRVLKVVKKLGFHPTRSARGLASKTSGNIGFILRDDHFSQGEPFYTRVFLGAEFAARDHNYYVLLATVSHLSSDKQDPPRFLLERNVDGVIIAGKVTEEFVDDVARFGIPMVFVDFEIKRKRYPAIQIDNRVGSRSAVTHLIECGHKEIAFVGGDITHPSLAERLDGYRQALSDHGIAEQARLIDTGEPNSWISDGAIAMTRLLKQRPRPTAVFAANDALAIGCMQQIIQAGLAIPGDIAVVGFDDIEVSSLMQPPMTTMRVFKEELGLQAVETLVEIIKGESKALVTKHMPVELIVRESTKRRVNGSTEKISHKQAP
jgi:LacI family transcriptional regulator